MMPDELSPKLRFPEFRSHAPWEAELGGKLFDQISDKSHNSDLPVLAITQEHGAIPRKLIDYHVSVSTSSLAGYKVVKPDDFIISLRSFQGGIEVSRYTGICSPAYVILRSSHPNVVEFFAHFFKSPEFIRLLNVNVEGLRDGKMISYKQFSDIPIPLPSRAEQKKVADCIEAIKDVISAENQKLIALKDHKAGLMQRLFPPLAEGAISLNISESATFKHWIETSIGSHILEVQEKSEIQDQYPVLTSSRGGLVRQDEYFEESRLSKRNNIGFNILPPDCITYRSRSDDDFYFFNENTLGITGIVSQYYPVFKISGGNTKFFLFLLERYARYIGVHGVGNAQRVLSLNALRSVSLPIPDSETQDYVAECLVSAERQIQVQSRKIDDLECHKLGLVQQLFPRQAFS
ncbi:restriction endonuclease subunit S [Tritonibacter litoralis]|nr:restriction endonuclease subunit S [Tritonibacter litoralis]